MITWNWRKEERGNKYKEVESGEEVKRKKKEGKVGRRR